ncbi:MAG: hypothetical protein ABSH14_16340 [Verrucomicrobiia bacterium]|jgi:hypothetical protein
MSTVIVDWILLAGLMMTVVTQGCVSIQVPTDSGKPGVIGVGSAKTVPGTSNQVFRIVSPGLSFRFQSYSPGVTLGWQETLLFFPSTAGKTNESCAPVAIQDKCVGIGFEPTEIMVGYGRSFAILLPAAGKNVIQLISYSEKNPTNTIVERKETP